MRAEARFSLLGDATWNTIQTLIDILAGDDEY